MRIGLDLPPHFRVFGAFFIYSFGLGGIFPRLAEIQASIGAPQGTFGLDHSGQQSFCGSGDQRFGGHSTHQIEFHVPGGHSAEARAARKPQPVLRGRAAVVGRFEHRLRP